MRYFDKNKIQHRRNPGGLREADYRQNDGSHDGRVRVWFHMEVEATESQGGATTPTCPRRPQNPGPALQGCTGPHGLIIVPFTTIAVTATTKSSGSQDSWPRGGR